jgi:dienelactone hydrolase
MKLPVLLLGLAVLTASALAEDIVTLPGTPPLTMTGDLSAQMHEAALRDMDQRIADSAPARAQLWHRDFSSSDAYLKSVMPMRERLKQILGLADPRVPVTIERFGDEENPALVAEMNTYRVWQVRWPVLAGVHGEGLLLEPKGPPRGFIVALPDADQTPEQIAGLAPGVPAESQFARRLVENGFQVVVPTLIDRSQAGSGDPAIAMTNQTHREWIHRQAYMMGRTLVGYEVQKVLAIVDYWAHVNRFRSPIGVEGYGEGGMIAFYAAAVDQRIDGAFVSGYFKSRQKTFEEPLYRNLPGILREFGDAEIASLIAPRGLTVEYSPEPAVHGPPPAEDGRKNCAAPGKLTTPEAAEVGAEYRRIFSLLPPVRNALDFYSWHQTLAMKEDGSVLPFGSDNLGPFSSVLGIPSQAPSEDLPQDLRRAFDPAARQLRQCKELEAHVPGLVRDSARVRSRFLFGELLPEYAHVQWTMALNFPPLAPEKIAAALEPARARFWQDIIGKIEDPLPAPNPRTRQIYDEPKWTGYEVVVDVGGEGFAWGILCVPKDLKPGERRPVVVCQHGRNGVPQDTITGDKPAYRNFAARLADQGFITFAPHNLYKNETYYRTLSRKGNTIGLSMFSVIVRHHQQWLNWLGSLPFVDAKRIAFYGLSYGGESAVRIPPLLDGYCLSICSGDFNDWPRKVASTDDKHSFMFTQEWEMPYFNMGNTFSYAELTYLLFPRPFMVERGHHDQVAPDEWVASEYAKTRWFYDQFGLGDRTAIEFFNGGHTINGQGTFAFLHKHLHWPETSP